MCTSRPSSFAALLLATLLLALIGASLSGCNAVQGAGKDITAMGQAGQDLISGAN
jgi:predicted small secreted protein